jgi:hypothetical protein
VFGIDVGLANGIAANVTSDNDDVGRKSAQTLIDIVGHGALVLIFTHDPHPGVHRHRAAEPVVRGREHLEHRPVRGGLVETPAGRLASFTHRLPCHPAWRRASPSISAIQLSDTPVIAF